MGQTGFCENLRFPAVFGENLRLPNAVIPRKSENLWKTANLAPFVPCSLSLLISLEKYRPALRGKWGKGGGNAGERLLVSDGWACEDPDMTPNPTPEPYKEFEYWKGFRWVSLPYSLEIQGAKIHSKIHGNIQISTWEFPSHCKDLFWTEGSSAYRNE